MQTYTNEQYNEAHKAKHREVPWLYLLPVAGAPIAHMLVSATKSFNNPVVKRWLWGGVAVSTVSMVVNRLWLLDDAWDDANPRYLEEQNKEFKRPENSPLNL